jgi:hypothetical protein
VGAFAAPFLKLSLFFPPINVARGMKIAFEIKTEPMTQVAIIIGTIAFSSGSIVTITISRALLPPVLSAQSRWGSFYTLSFALLLTDCDISHLKRYRTNVLLAPLTKVRC